MQYHVSVEVSPESSITVPFGCIVLTDVNFISQEFCMVLRVGYQGLFLWHFKIECFSHVFGNVSLDCFALFLCPDYSYKKIISVSHILKSTKIFVHAIATRHCKYHFLLFIQFGYHICPFLCIFNLFQSSFQITYSLVEFTDFLVSASCVPFSEIFGILIHVLVKVDICQYRADNATL